MTFNPHRRNELVARHRGLPDDGIWGFIAVLLGLAGASFLVVVTLHQIVFG